jgi:virulence factor Mce-like protein
MDKGAPSITKIVTMVLFALSCVGLLLFLWLSFGGPIPFKAQGYRLRVSFTNASQLATQADVRIAGVSVGKVVDKSLDPQGGRTIAVIEMENKYAPVHSDARAILRQKTILGETYVELSPGSANAGYIPDGGLLNRSQVKPAIALDEVFSALDPPTRRAFQVWQQELAKAVRNNDQNLNNVLGNLPSFAADASDILRVLDIEHIGVVRLVQNGATVFAALSQDQSALRNLITSGETTFATTAANNNALADIFHVFPTFLSESKATMLRLKSFSLDTRPLLTQLEPVARDLGPTLHSVRLLSPDLRHLFVQLGPLIDASKTGLPALRDTLHGATPLLGQLGPFLSQLNPILGWLANHQNTVADFIQNGAYGLAARTTSFGGGGNGHYLRQFQPLGLETVSIYRNRLPNNRGNTYPGPLWLQGPDPNTNGIVGSWDCNNTGAPGDGSVGELPGTSPLTPGHPPCWVAPPLGDLVGQPGQKMAHVLAKAYPTK